MKAVRILAAGLVPFALGVLPVLAAKPEQACCAAVPTLTAPVKALAQVRTIERASELLAMPVRNVDGSLRGVVKDIVLNDPRTQVHHLVVAFAGDKVYHNVAFGALRITPDAAMLVCDVTPGRLFELNGFRPTAWPAAIEPLRATRLLGVTVRDAGNARVGRIRDLLIASQDGRVIEATVAVPVLLGFRHKLASVGWGEIRLPAGADRFARTTLTVGDVRSLAYNEGAYWQRLGFSGTPPAEIRPMNDMKAPPNRLDPLDDPFRLYR